MHLGPSVQVSAASDTDRAARVALILEGETDQEGNRKHRVAAQAAQEMGVPVSA